MLTHYSCKNLFNSSRFVAFHFSTQCLIIDHKFSTEFASGLFEGQSITSDTSLDKNCRVGRLLCLELLSCCSRHRRPNCLLASGMR